MNKTIYLKDADVAVWEEAKRIAEGTISAVIISGLKMWLENQPYCAQCKNVLKKSAKYCSACGTLRTNKVGTTTPIGESTGVAVDRRCGTCRWWEKTTIGVEWGMCYWTPNSNHFPLEAFKLERLSMYPHEGRCCSCYIERQAGVKP